jgi:predicted metal-binding membrane protein
LLLRRGALRAGLEHGVLCLGCCWALMLALLALGAGSLLWMAAVAAAIFVEKVTSVGARASAPVAVALLGAAIWIVS